MKKTTLSELFSNGGKMGSLMDQFDWTQSPLGQPEFWSQPLRTVVDLMLNCPSPMFVAWGRDLGFLYNDAYSEILGAKHPAALGNAFKDIWHEIWDEVGPIAMQAMAGQASLHNDLRLEMQRNGFTETTWFSFSYSPVRDETGTVNGVFCVCTETTNQVLATQNRAEETETLRNLFQQAPGAIAVLRGPTHIIETANDAYIQLVGHREVVGLSVRNAFPELEGQGFYELLDQVYSTGEAFVARELKIKLQRVAGGELEERFLDFVYQPIRDHLGKMSGIFFEGHDVTESVRVHQALRESERQFHQLANTIPQLAWMANPDGWIHWYNDRWYEYTGTTLEDIAGWGWQRVHHPDRLPSLIEEWKTSIATGAPFETTFPIRGVDGTYRTFFTRAEPLRDANGNIVQWFGTNTDVTQIEAVQKELKAANERKDEFLAMLAHELRNPLAPILTAAELLKLAATDEKRVRKTSEIISRQVTHMTGLIDDLLDVSRVTRGLIALRKETLEVNSVILDAIEQARPLIEAKNHHFTVDAPNQKPLYFAGDRTRMVQVLCNILNNAAKYTPVHGHITLKVDRGDDFVNLMVQDDGVGITEDLQPYIFDLFTQAKRSSDRSQGGLGLGLALVKSLVELHDGQVTLQSAGLGRGSTFIVSLPLVSNDRVSPAVKPRSEAPAVTNTKQLLVVDDNKDAAEMLSMLLETAGHSVAIAHNATEALRVAKQSPPEILFLDIGLPDMDGYALAERLRSLPETARAVLVAVTGYGRAEDRERALQAGFDHHLVKPVKPDDVLELLKSG